MNNREVGDEFEKYLANQLNLKTTAKSGGYWDNGDIVGKDVIIECKVKSVSFLRIAKNEIKKVINQAEKHSKDWVYTQRTDGGDFVICSLDFFLEATEEYFKNQ